MLWHLQVNETFRKDLVRSGCFQCTFLGYGGQHCEFGPALISLFKCDKICLRASPPSPKLYVRQHYSLE